MNDIAVEVELLAQRFHDKLLEIAAEEEQAVLVGQHDHVFLPLAAGGVVPHQGQERGGVAGRVVHAGGHVHGGGAFEHAVHVKPLEEARHETDGRHLAGPAADPVPHGESSEPTLLLGLLVELRSGAGHGDGMAGEVETLPGVGIGHDQHAVAGFRGRAALAHDDDQGFGKLVSQAREHASEAVGVGVVNEVRHHLVGRAVPQRVGHEHRSQGRAADPDREQLGEAAGRLRLDLRRVDLGGERLDRRERVADLRRDLGGWARSGARSQ